MDPLVFLVQCLNAIQYGFTLFLIASGLTLVFGILGVINLAHGSLYMVGAYLAYALTPLSGAWGGNFALTVLLGLVLSIVFGYLLEWVFFSFLYKRNHLQQVLMTYGLILVLEELRAIFFGNKVHSVPIPASLTESISLFGVVDYPVYRMVIILACVLVSAGMYVLLQHTRLGMTIRASANNPEMTRTLGINVPRLLRIVFSLGVALTALAGMLSAPITSVYPGMGNTILITCFVVVVIGGLGSVTGALVAAFVVSFTDTFGKVLMPEFASIAIYILMAAVLLWRPQGLLGRS